MRICQSRSMLSLNFEESRDHIVSICRRQGKNPLELSSGEELSHSTTHQ